jgi:chemotaxis protein MotB
MRASRTIAATAMLLTSLLATGCQNGGKQLKAENQSLKDQNAQLQRQVADYDARLRSAPDASQLQAVQNEIAARESRIRDLESQLRKPEPGTAADPSMAGIQTTYDRSKGELTVNLPADILFASGSADLKPTAKSTLDKVVRAVKKDYANKRIRVEGHTDSDPIVKTKSKWTDNLDLSQNRAAAVTRYLISQGVDKKNLATVGYGDAHPKGNKAASRRVEIVVVTG